MSPDDDYLAKQTNRRVVRKLKNKFDDNSFGQTNQPIKTSPKPKIINYFNEAEYISKDRLDNENVSVVRTKMNTVFK